MARVDSRTLGRRAMRRLLACGLALVCTGIPETAQADPFGGQPGGYPWRADGADHWYCFFNIPVDQKYRYHQAMGALDTQTDMYDQYTGACRPSTDVYYVIDYNLQARGRATCVALQPGSSTVCDAFWVAVNPLIILANPGTAGPDISYNKTIAHETGHTTGLTHSDTTNSAMRSGPIPDLGGFNFVWDVYDTTHHVPDHINPTY